MAIVDSDKRFVHVNRAYVELLGYNTSELLGRPFTLVTHPEDIPENLVLWDDLFRLEEFSSAEDKRYIRKDGRVLWVRVTANLFKPSDGTAPLVMAVVESITERKQAEQALRQSEARYLALIEAIPQQVWTARPDGTLDYVNRRVLDYFNAPAERLLDWEWQSVLHPDDLPACMTAWTTSLQTGEPYEIEFRLKQAGDDAYRWHLARALPIRDEAGRIVKWFGTNTDITGRRHVEEALRESEERFRVLADTAPVLIWMSGLDKRVIYFNTCWLDYTGRTMEQELGDGWVDGLHPEDIDRCLKTYSEAFDRREPFELEYRLRKGNGQYGWLHEGGAPRFLPGGTFAGYHGACIDITARKLAEENLQRTRFAMDQAVDAVYWIDPHARILYTNDAASAMLGYTPDEFLRMTVHDLNPNFPPEMWPEFWADTREKKVVSFETFHLAKDGRRIPIDIRVSFLAYSGQEFHCAFVRDITARKQVDEALRESQERFELAARATNDGIWDWNIMTGGLYWSDRTFELLGLEPGALIPSYEVWLSVVHPVDAERAHRAVYRHLETHDPYDIEIRVKMKDGRYRWFRDLGQAVWDATGRPVRMVGSMSDVTERRTAEEALRTAHAELERRVVDRTAQLAMANQSLQDEITERKSAEEAVRDSELRYKLLTEATFDGIAIHDQGVLIEVNAGLERIFGYGPGELIGRSLWDLVADESRDLILANMQNGVNGPYEAMGRRKDGTTFPGEVVVRPYCYRGKEVRLVAGRDITERKHLEEERSRHTEELEHQIAERTAEIAKLESQRAQTEKLAAMGRLAAGVAHEINNPIAGIKNAFMLVRQAVDPAHPHAEFAGMIDREIARVASIVQNMYQLYRPESGKGEAVEFQPMMNDIEALFAKRLQQHRLMLAIDVDPCIDRLCVPRGDLLQVLLNLLNNAIDCSSEGGTITLILRVEPDAIRIAVSDQGPGIPQENLPHIFDPFFTTKTGGDQKGMGLGLSVSQSLVTAMGGKIDVQTRLNDGSTFSVLLPRYTAVACTLDQSNTKEVMTR